MTLPDLPQNIEAEQAVLGSILLNRDAIVAVAPWLNAEYFYVQRHAQIYEAMLACYNARIPPDVRTVSDELRRRERLEAVGGVVYLAQLVDHVPTSYHVEFYARIVERTALLRKLIEAGGRIAALGYEEAQDLEVTLDKAESTLFEISQRRNTQDFVHIGQVIDAYYEQINYLQEHRGEVVGVPTSYRDLDQITGGLQRSDLIILAARPGVGKCVAAWTLIDDPATGERLTIEECVRRQIPAAYGISEAGEVRPALVSHWVDSGLKPCFRVRTRNGRFVDVTGHHPFLTVSGWQPLHDLKVGDHIAVPRALPCFGTDESWPVELVRLLAYFIASGICVDGSPAFISNDSEIAGDFRACLVEQFPNVWLREQYNNVIVDYRGDGQNPVAEWLAALGVDPGAHNHRTFPTCVWRWSRGRLAEFLRGLMDCAGQIYGVAGQLRIDVVVPSRRLAEDIQHAFVRFGLLGRLWQRQDGAWCVEMNDPESIARYRKEIGWLGFKRAMFTGAGWWSQRRPSRADDVPREAWAVVRQAARARGLSLVELAQISGERTRTPRRDIPRSRIETYNRVLGCPELARMAGSDIYWDDIVAIEAIGEHQVYDLTVPDGANFIAQDVCVHNTSFVMSLAYNVALDHQSTVGVFSLEMSRDQLVQRLLAMDTRIDTHRLRLGQLREEEMERVISAMGKLAAAPIYIEDTPGLSIMEVRSRARRLQSQSGVDLIIIDYLQLMAGRRSDNRVQEVGEISRGLKALARELNVPVIALSQLSRAVEGRTSHVPMLSDLRESGCLAGESLVYLPDEGVYRRIDSLVGKSGFNVLAVNTETWKLEPRPVLRAFATGRKPVFRLTTRLGRSVRATGNHKFLTVGGWERLDELAAGERLALPRPGFRDMLPGRTGNAAVGHAIGAGVDPGTENSGTAMAAADGGDVCWDAIVSIEPDGEAEVYDLTVDGLHNFVANDLTLHNSIEQDADIVMFIYREELYDQNTDKKGIAEIHIAKHRNGPVGVVPMRFDPGTTRFYDLTYRTPDGY